jgi:hypothetical protein
MTNEQMAINALMLAMKGFEATIESNSQAISKVEDSMVALNALIISVKENQDRMLGAFDPLQRMVEILAAKETIVTVEAHTNIDTVGNVGDNLHIGSKK